ncbi:unnamed protein product [Blepharisma stoltei]|uniref:Uncharacterized protein n=1 Tax=Blepharisma stoltei TaxID=1481888 RepID=A0AAU9JQE9_9CILI|nr:unnamed protein product [Blepharisma stoltei]
MAEPSKKLKNPTLNSPLFSIIPSPTSKLLSPKTLTKLIKPLHRRTQSDFINPYLDRRDLKSLKASNKLLTRQNSPQETKNTPQVPKKSRLTSTVKPKAQIKTNKIVKTSKPANKPATKLTELQGEPVFKAPKLYANQFFTDVYDIDGNHDRIFDIEDSIEIYHEVGGDKRTSEPCVIFNISTLEKAKQLPKVPFRAPENSYAEESREMPEKLPNRGSIGDQLRFKLDKMLKDQDQDSQSEETTSVSGGKSRV